MDFEILFVDDDKDILFIVQKYLSRQGYGITVVDNGIRALELVKERNFDLVFTDFRMPDFDGLELLMGIKEYRPETEVVIVTGYGTMESAIKAMKYGSYDYIQKPFKLDSLKLLIDRVIEEKRLRDENIVLKRRIKDGQRHRCGDMLGMSLKMQVVYETIDRVGGDSSFVLVKGESGTGKHLIARTIHQKSPRKDGPFVPVNCGSIREGVPEGQVFNHVVELWETTKGGTIYLDEITEIAPSLQSKFLGLFDEKKIGGEDHAENKRDMGARVIAASRMDLEEAIENGGLREDFFKLFSDITIQLPPLRERKEDICLLMNQFLYQHNMKHSKKIGCVSPEALDVLLDYHWPGNVIQLGNVIERAFAMGVEGIINLSDLPPEVKTFGETAKNKER